MAEAVSSSLAEVLAGHAAYPIVQRAVAAAPLQDGDVLVATAKVASPETFAGFEHLLSSDELKRSDRFRHAADRTSFVAAHILKRLLLAEVSGRDPSELQFTSDSGEKPRLTGLPFCFSLSHTRGAVAVATGLADVGIDIEAARDIEVETLAGLVLGPSEQDELAAAECKRSYFLERWVIKEAVSKAWGLGLMAPFAQIETSEAVAGWRTARQADLTAYAASWQLVDLHLAVAQREWPPRRLCLRSFEFTEDPFRL